MEAKIDYVQRDLEQAFRSSARELAAARTRLELAELEVAAATRWVTEAQEHFDQLRAAVISTGGNTTPGIEALRDLHAAQRSHLGELSDQELLRVP